jgi:hypothetical protein
LGDRTILVDIQWCGCVKWQLKFFYHHPTMGVCRMVTEFFWALFATTPLLTCPFFLGDRKKLVTIR